MLPTTLNPRPWTLYRDLYGVLLRLYRYPVEFSLSPKPSGKMPACRLSSSAKSLGVCRPVPRGKVGFRALGFRVVLF